MKKRENKRGNRVKKCNAALENEDRQTVIEFQDSCVPWRSNGWKKKEEPFRRKFAFTVTGILFNDVSSDTEFQLKQVWTRCV